MEELATIDMLFWGVLGGFVVDALELHKVVKNNGGNWPKDCRSVAFIIVEIFRLASGGIVAVAMFKSDQISGVGGAFVVGITTPIIVEKLAAQLPGVKIGSE